MLSSRIFVQKQYLHMRPAAVLTTLAGLIDSCDVSILEGGNRYDAKSIMNWILNIMNAEQPVVLEVDSGDKSVRHETIQFQILKTALLNLKLIHSVFQLDRNGSTSPRIMPLNQLLLQIVDALAKEEIETGEILLNRINGALGLRDDRKVIKKNAVLDSAEGLDRLPCTLLAAIANILTSRVTMNFIGRDGDPDSTDLTSAGRLLELSIRNEARLTVCAEGIDAERAARCIKYLIDNLDRKIHPWICRKNADPMAADTAEKLLKYIEAELLIEKYVVSVNSAG
jgi:phosphotransferase system HPr-like phosphotransfer protein